MKKLILEIHVSITGYNTVESKRGKIVMIEFDAECDCELFKGKTVARGVDTQRIFKSGNMELSARYMLEGIDCKGLPCRVFIENNGNDLSYCTPKIVTDSEALGFLETAYLSSEVLPAENGINVRIYEI